MIVIYTVFIVIAIAISTLSLAASLWIIGEEGTNPFHTDGAGPTFAKCAVICVVATGLSLIPYGSLLALIVWFAAVMALFEKTFLEALLVALVGGVVSWVLRVGLLALLVKAFATGTV